ncbi:MAG: hypothetical protein ACT4PV_06305 [Planctomycetaceae bacterium]
MRLLLLFLVGAALFLAGYLLGAGNAPEGGRGGRAGPNEPVFVAPREPTDAPARARDPAPPPSPPSLPALLETVRGQPSLSPRTQKRLAAFVHACAARGEGALPELLAFLRTGEDVEAAKTWSFVDGELREYPSLRAACLEALRAIPGRAATDALREAFASPASLEEATYAALALHERGDASWVGALLERAARSEAPAQQHIVKLAAQMAGAADPEAAGAALEAAAPRGDARGDPKDLAAVLTGMPLASARATALRLLQDGAVTVLAKSRYLRAISRRNDPEAVAILREALEGPGLQGDLRVDAANAAVDAAGFFEDLRLLEMAQAQGDGPGADGAIRRLRDRSAEARRAVGAAFGVDPASTSDPRATLLLQRIREIEERIEERPR